jgi:hypothetical protein
MLLDYHLRNWHKWEWVKLPVMIERTICKVARRAAGRRESEGEGGVCVGSDARDDHHRPASAAVNIIILTVSFVCGQVCTSLVPLDYRSNTHTIERKRPATERTGVQVESDIFVTRLSLRVTFLS